VARILAADFGYVRTPPTRSIAPGRNGAIATGGEPRWRELLDNIHAGRALHDSLNALAAMVIRAGMDRGAATHLLGALMEASDISHD
jgi:hypothetical protein